MNTRNNKFNLTTFFLFMNSIAYKQLYVFTGLFLIIIMSPKALCISHPHMIVTESEYAGLQARATQWPWSVMKTKAIDDATHLTYNPAESYQTKCYRAQDIASSCALAYILDPDNRPALFGFRAMWTKMD